MAIVVPNEGEAEVLARLVNKNTPDDLVIHLFVNDVTPAEGDTVATYTEATATGYAPISLSGANWSINTVADTTTAEYPQVSFVFTAAEPHVYGYYITNSANNILIIAERFTDGPYAISAGGGTIKITPKIVAD